MKIADKIAAVDSSELDLLLSLINDLSPHALDRERIAEWKKLPSAKRKQRISTFLEEKQYNEQTLKQIYAGLQKPGQEKNKKRALLYFKTTAYGALLLAIAAIIYAYYVFNKKERVYAIDNNIKLYTKNGTTVAGTQMDLFGRTLQNKAIVSVEKMVFIKSEGDRYRVKPDNFMKWLFAGDEDYEVDSSRVSRDYEKCQNYKKIFAEFNTGKPANDSFLTFLSLRDRANVYEMIFNNDAYRDYIVSTLPQSFPPSIGAGPFCPFIPEDNGTDRLLFLTLKKGTDFKNVRIVDSLKMPVIEPINPQTSFSNQIIWMLPPPHPTGALLQIRFKYEVSKNNFETWEYATPYGKQPFKVINTIKPS